MACRGRLAGALEAMRTAPAAERPSVALNRASILFPAVSDKRAQAQVQVHARPADPGRLRGRDDHAAPVHDRHGATPPVRRRRRLRASRARASRSARSSKARHTAGNRWARWTCSPTTTTSRSSITLTPSIGEAGKTTVYVRKFNAEDRHRPLRQGHALHRDLQPLRAPRLPGALGGRRGALHLPVPRRRLRPARATGRWASGQTARPLLHPRVRRKRRSRPALQRQQRAAPLLATRPRRAARRHRPVPVPVAARAPRNCKDGCDLAQDAKAPSSAAPVRPEGAAAAPRRGERQGGPRRGGQACGHHRRRLGRRAHLAERRRPLDDVPQGAQGHQLVLHARLGDDVRLPLPGRHGRVPGDVLPPRPRRRRLRIDPLRHQRRVPRPVRARHAQVGLERDGDPRLPAHGPHVLLRRLQVSARAELGDRRGAADPDDDDVLHRLPAAVRPAGLLGDDRGREHQRHRARCSARTSATSCAAGSEFGATTLSRFYAIHMLLVPGPDRRADRRAPVPRRQARHDGAAVEQSREASEELREAEV